MKTPFQDLISSITSFSPDDPDDLPVMVISIPAVVKAHASSDGRRMVEVDSSCEEMDAEGDVIEQKALLDSSESFIKNGHIDIDHISELGLRYGVPNPESYIIGRPEEVHDIGDKHTSVLWECRRDPSGHDAAKNKFDMFWDSLKTEPPVRWQASIYGFPFKDAVIDCREGGNACSSGARRFHIKAIDWRSLAMTRTPVQTHLKGYAKVVSAKSWMLELAKSGAISPPPTIPHFDQRTGSNGLPYEAPTVSLTDIMPTSAPPPVPQAAAPASTALSLPRTMDDLLGQYHGHMKRECPHSQGLRTTVGFKAHFEHCCGLPPHIADILAHALMHKLLLESRRVS